MAGQQPVICNLLKLPPEQQVFFRMGELSLVFLQEFDNLDAILEASQDAHSFHQVVTILDELRNSAADVCDDLWITTVVAFNFAQHYHELLAALSGEMEYEIVLKISKVVGIAGLNEERIEKASKGVSQLGESIKNAIRRVIDATDGDLKNSSKGFLCDPDNIQVVMELFQATGECGRLLRECRDYYRMSQNLSADDKLNLPSEGEITLMRERWFAFSHGMDNFIHEYPRVAGMVRNDPAD